MRYVAAALLLVASALPARAQDEKAIQTVVESFLTRLGDHQFDTLDADFTPKAIVAVTRQRAGSSEWTNNYVTAEEWIASLKKNPNPTVFREPISNVKVTIDSDRLAYVRADFHTVRDGKTTSTGVDQFTLFREPSGWKIAAIAYTSMPASQTAK